ncbi:dehydrogenase/reductase SDR family member 7 isoform X2 [Patella vulgata]|nr:dehydrogenase/reductase SDR family member 7 isoform X2 [Patella vulgata]
MFLLTVGIIIIILYAVVQLIRIILADCDLSLQYAQYMGTSTYTALAHKVVWITGASSGIGEYLAYELAQAGCKLVLSARREDELNRVKKQCLTSGPIKEEDILVLPLDLLKFDSHKDAVDKVLQNFNKIDVLVNNAGRSQRAAWIETDIEVDRQMFELNVLGTLSLTKAVLPKMVEQKSGHIVVISSAAGKLGAPNSGSYTGSKHALHGYFESLRIESALDNIEITMVCPGPVFSNILATAFTEENGKMLQGQMQQGEKRMSTSRCAALTATAIANKLDEVWISPQPVLIFMYLFQYMPTIARRIGVKMGVKGIKKLREGQQ